jgi:NADH:ubiquinone oxidoreductase subunit 5 (subunit L)/multisubunit Na+/H+ antiporter MnhA subunit
VNNVNYYILLCCVVAFGLLVAPKSGKYSRFLLILQTGLLLVAFFSKKNFLTIISLEFLSFVYFFLYPRNHKDNGKSISSFIVSGSVSAIFLSVWIFLPNESIVGSYFLAIAVFIKSSLFLFHFWMPSAYENGTYEINSFSSGVMAIFPFYLFLEFVYPLWNDPIFYTILAFVASTGVFVGGVSSYFQSRVSLILAYSSVEKLNFLWLTIALAGIAKSTNDGNLPSLEKPFLVLFYFALIQHSVSKVFQFSLMGRIWKSRETNEINRIRGYGRYLKIPLVVSILGTASFMAIPGTSGFLSESLYLLLSSQILDIPSGKSIAVLPVLVLVFTGLVSGGVSHLRLFFSVFLSTPRESQEDSMVHSNNSFFDLYWLGGMILVPSVMLPFIMSQYFTGTIYNWVIDSGYLSIITIVSISFLVYFERKQSNKKLTWDCGSDAEINRTSITAETYSLPVRSSLGRYLVRANGDARIDKNLEKFVLALLNPFWYRTRKLLDEEDLSNYLAISSAGVLAILLLFFIKDIIGF